jgi:hypothetical protein
MRVGMAAVVLILRLGMRHLLVRVVVRPGCTGATTSG